MSDSGMNREVRLSARSLYDKLGKDFDPETKSFSDRYAGKSIEEVFDQEFGGDSHVNDLGRKGRMTAETWFHRVGNAFDQNADLKLTPSETEAFKNGDESRRGFDTAIRATRDNDNSYLDDAYPDPQPEVDPVLDNNLATDFDTDGDGIISRSEFIENAQEFGFPDVSQSSSRGQSRAYRDFVMNNDENGDRFVSVTEAQNLRDANTVDAIDSNDNGQIDYDEYVEHSQRLSGRDLTNVNDLDRNEDFLNFIDNFDYDGDGEVNKDEAFWSVTVPERDVVASDYDFTPDRDGDGFDGSEGQDGLLSFNEFVAGSQDLIGRDLSDKPRSRQENAYFRFASRADSRRNGGDGDGLLSVTEAQNYVEQRSIGRRGRGRYND